MDRELMKMKGAFCMKLAAECCQFKESILGMEKEEILGAAYRIDHMLALYEILLEEHDRMDRQTLEMLLAEQQLLERFYGNWMKIPDSHYEEMQQSISAEIKRMGAEHPAGQPQERREEHEETGINSRAAA